MWKRIGEILSCLHKGVTIADAQGVLVYAGDFCQEMFGVEKEKIEGKDVDWLEANGIFAPCITKTVLIEQKPVKSVQKNKDGREIFVTGIPVFFKDGSLEAVICYSSWEIEGYEDLRKNYERLQQDNFLLRKELQELKKREESTGELICRSKSTRDNLRLLKKFAEIKSPVFLCGPSGCGKGFLARRMFMVSQEYNCELMPERELEEKLFGEDGILQEGNQVLLLHVENIPAGIQHRIALLLREREIKVIATSDLALDELRAKGQITNDFYYLFRACEVYIPPLCERGEDLSRFLEYYLEYFNQKYHRSVYFSPRAMESLLNYSWKDNINEVKYTLERIILTAEKDKVEVYQLPEKISEASAERFERASLKDAMEFYERGIIIRAYEKCKTSVRLSEELGISQATAVRKIQKYIKQ